MSAGKVFLSAASQPGPRRNGASVDPTAEQIAPALLGILLSLGLPAFRGRIRIGSDRPFARHVQAAGIARQSSCGLGVLATIPGRTIGLGERGPGADDHRRGEGEQLLHGGVSEAPCGSPAADRGWGVGPQGLPGTGGTGHAGSGGADMRIQGIAPAPGVSRNKPRRGAEAADADQSCPAAHPDHRSSGRNAVVQADELIRRAARSREAPARLSTCHGGSRGMMSAGG